MNNINYNIVFIGLSLSSSWGNGHATTYRALLKALHRRGHRLYFLERDTPWYAAQRDLPVADFCELLLYHSPNELKSNFLSIIRDADVVIVGSYVPDGVVVGEWVIDNATGLKAFYDIDTPVTLAKLQKQDHEYITPGLIQAYDLYLSFTGGNVLDLLEKKYGSPAARPLYCSADPEKYFPEEHEKKWNLGYLGTYSDDRQPVMEKLMFQAAENCREQKFIVAGPQYPEKLKWPSNVQHIEHLPPSRHRGFYNMQQFTLNVTRQEMVKLGYSPSVRLFEAAACGTPIISDNWEGLNDFFTIGEEILVADSTNDVCNYLSHISDNERRRIAEKAREKVLSFHTAGHRAQELEQYVKELNRSFVPG